MFLSSMRAPRPRLPALAGVALLALSAGPAPAQTVAETLHYQVEIGLNCFLGVLCYGAFPEPGAKRRLHITRVSCALRAEAGSRFGYGSLYLWQADGSVALAYQLPGDSSGPNGLHLLNREVDLQVGARQHLSADLQLDNGTASTASCTASGTLDKLQ